MSDRGAEVRRLLGGAGRLLLTYGVLGCLVLAVMVPVALMAAAAVDLLELTGDARAGLSLCCGFSGFAFLVWLVAMPRSPPPTGTS